MCFVLTCDSSFKINQLLAVHIKALMDLIQKLIVLTLMSIVIV